MKYILKSFFGKKTKWIIIGVDSLYNKRKITFGKRNLSTGMMKFKTKTVHTDNIVFSNLNWDEQYDKLLK